MLYAWDLAAVFVFAVSGALAGRQKQMDLWGMFVVALITGTGGGTLRSILINDLPPPILVDPAYFAIAAPATLVARFGERLWDRAHRIVSLFDAAGLGLFASLGITISLDRGLAPWAALAMGVVTAVFGGVLRDIVRAEVPLIFRREIYATAALAGGVLFLLCEHFGLPRPATIPATAAVTLLIRLLAIRYRLNVPR